MEIPPSPALQEVRSSSLSGPLFVSITPALYDPGCDGTAMGCWKSSLLLEAKSGSVAEVKTKGGKLKKTRAGHRCCHVEDTGGLERVPGAWWWLRVDAHPPLIKGGIAFAKGIRTTPPGLSREDGITQNVLDIEGSVKDKLHGF
ncbi:hypothetical protein TREES_T100008366 [Tupaia chinensis]|uniref:Uncharacterized protein n=1 Tax=Tupaia chinensis TaxID=246437 RepID=L9LAY8_TUPCH|nr:hypothetical protein TREES_T100008366 [Tupaia chinensis]